ncbi:hypothetical protein [Leptospira ilyithenensis]|uniref:Uncharacterized protein n=1 Tax=Leptospira ilyithenensis TaxID=2484901 RepID=A0A4R9LVP7_9LEPT|nr:hypothetical protein [Leptospira ilyithenensis]TGN13779.1 hypothetical protein EHS11_03385 [Leptospira ilyithenensis]
MELFSLVLINILFGGILYVFVSAKVQKSVSEYYDKKLDRAIDMATSETIKELDATVGVIESRLVALRSMIEKAELIAKEFKHYESVNVERPANKQTLDEVPPFRELGMSLEKELSQAKLAEAEPTIHSLKEQRSGVGEVYRSNQFLANESEVVTTDGAVNQVFGKLGRAVKGILGMEGMNTPTNDAIGAVELPQFKPKMDFTVGGNPFSEKKEESNIIRDENKEGKTRKEFLTEMAYANDPAYASHQRNFEDQIVLSLESALEELPASAGKIDKVVHLLKKGYSHEDISDVMNIGTHEIHLIETIRLDRSRRI